MLILVVIFLKIVCLILFFILFKICICIDLGGLLYELVFIVLFLIILVVCILLIFSKVVRILFIGGLGFL